ncbi:MAG: FAD-binding domain-containing protein, partial [Myxococcota bacterium]
YDRDIRVARWCKARGLPWTELSQTGVLRPHPARDGWAERWTRRMQRPLVPKPESLPVPAWPVDFDFGNARCEDRFGVPASTKTEAVVGGEAAAQRMLDSFLSARGVNYRSDMSSPVEGWEGCSRLSPYIAWGNISIKTVYQFQRRRLDQVRRSIGQSTNVDPRWRASLESFESRLRWHCHFMQKLEDEPPIEFRNMHRGYDGLRQEDPASWRAVDRVRFDAWCSGRTGYPLIDAVMRCLHKGGWINFRMRAMLVSFASYHLWLHWRPCAVFLAQHFLDFEPGIHFSQFQMQAGTTGINSIRIYNPIKQVEDQDPAGTFIRRYVPELAEVPIEYLAEPHKMSPMLQSDIGVKIGSDYPSPIVEHAAAYNAAKTRMFRWRQRPQLRKEAQRVVHKHGSRKRPMTRR